MTVFPSNDDIQDGMKVLVELKKDRGTGTLTEGIVKKKLTKVGYDENGIVVVLEKDEKGIEQQGRVHKILDYTFVDKKNPDPVISIMPNQGLSNRRKIIEFLSKAEDFIYIIVGYWKNKHFDILKEVLDNNDSVKEIKIISTLPFLQTDRQRLDKKEFELISQYGNLFRGDLRIKKISVDFKFLTEKKVGREIHDRFYFTKNKSYNFIDLDVMLVSQRADISRTDNGADFEKKLNEDFNKYWEYPTTFSIFGENNVKLLQERLDELENNRLKQLEDETKRLKKKEEKNKKLEQEK